MAKTIAEAQELTRRISAQVDRDGFFDHVAIRAICESALLTVAREQRERAFDEAIERVKKTFGTASIRRVDLIICLEAARDEIRTQETSKVGE